MMPVKTITLMILATAVSHYGMTVSIQGTVTDSSGTGIRDAVVQFEKCELNTTTAEDGGFIFTGEYTSIRMKMSNKSHMPMLINSVGNCLHLHLFKPSVLSVAIFDLKGHLLYHDNSETPVEKYRLEPDRIADGLYLFRTILDGKVHLFKVNKSGGRYTFSFHNISTLSNPPASANAAAKESFSDVIFVKKEGYVDYREDIRAADTAGIEVRMINSAGSVEDIDGNVYQTIKLGNQIWTAQNLCCTTLVNGTQIRNSVTDGFGMVTDPQFGYFGSDNGNRETVKKYGVMYNWYAVNTGLLAPKGWHVPGDAEWDTLIAYLAANGYNCEGGSEEKYNVGKALASKTGWWIVQDSCRVGFKQHTNNSTGFSGLPAGQYFEVKNFWDRGYNGYWWTSTGASSDNAVYYSLDSERSGLIRNQRSKGAHFSVRLVKD